MDAEAQLTCQSVLSCWSPDAAHCAAAVVVSFSRRQPRATQNSCRCGCGCDAHERTEWSEQVELRRRRRRPAWLECLFPDCLLADTPCLLHVALSPVVCLPACQAAGPTDSRRPPARRTGCRYNAVGPWSKNRSPSGLVSGLPLAARRARYSTHAWLAR
ncbi:hypothetical protein HDK64DRAFT_273696 [Phyllosticta capitalensis]